NTVLRALLGASHDSDTDATTPDGKSSWRKATSGRFGRTIARPVVRMRVGTSLSTRRMIDRSCGARSQITLTSDWCSPRFNRADVTYWIAALARAPPHRAEQ